MPGPRWAEVLGEHLNLALAELCDRAAATIEALAVGDRLVLCHGDLQLANALVDGDGQAWLLDLEYACLAPREWDPAKLLILSRRFADPSSAEDVLAAWPTLDPDRLAACVAVQETQLVAWLTRMAVDGASGAAAEARHRARTLLGKPQPWRHLR
jgi:thiamine kinase-like enzyme